jgi:hypothetical protein
MDCVMVEAAGVEPAADTKPQMADIRGFTLDFSQLLNIFTSSISSKNVFNYNPKQPILPVFYQT